VGLLLGTTTSSTSEDSTVDSVTGHGVNESATGDGVVGSTSVGEVGGLPKGARITASCCATGPNSSKACEIR